MGGLAGGLQEFQVRYELRADGFCTLLSVGSPVLTSVPLSPPSPLALISCPALPLLLGVSPIPWLLWTTVFYQQSRGGGQRLTQSEHSRRRDAG